MKNKAPIVRLKMKPYQTEDCVQVTCSADLNREVRKYFNPDTIAFQEQFIVLYLNRQNRIIAAYPTSIGGVSGTVADPRVIIGAAVAINTETELLKMSLMHMASGIILAHNHPSGNLRPSESDTRLTNKLRDGAKLFDIQVLDHLIVIPGSDRYYSYADEGLL